MSDTDIKKSLQSQKNTHIFLDSIASLTWVFRPAYEKLQSLCCLIGIYIAKEPLKLYKSIKMLSNFIYKKNVNIVQMKISREGNIATIVNSPTCRKLTENLTEFASPSRASSSRAGPPPFPISRPSHLAVLSYASPIASSTVVPSWT